MRACCLLSLSVVALLINATASLAFSTDDKTMNDTKGAPRFSDPDDKLPTTIFTTGGATSNYGQDNTGNPSAQGSYPATAAPFSPSNTPAPRH